MKNWKPIGKRVVACVTAIVGMDELVLCAGIALASAGVWQVWKPGAYLLPGLVLIWMALPPRKAFIVRVSDAGAAPPRKDGR